MKCWNGGWRRTGALPAGAAAAGAVGEFLQRNRGMRGREGRSNEPKSRIAYIIEATRG